MSNEAVMELTKAAPAIGYGGVYLLGYSIADVVSMVMLVYGICLLIVTVPKAYAQVKAWVTAWRSKKG